MENNKQPNTKTKDVIYSFHGDFINYKPKVNSGKKRAETDVTELDRGIFDATASVIKPVSYNKFTVVSDPRKRRKRRSAKQLQQERLNQSSPDKAESLPSAKKSYVKDKPDESSLTPPKSNEQNGRYNTTFPFTNTIADDLDLNSTYSDEVEIPELVQKITEQNEKKEKRITALKEQIRKLTEQKEEKIKALDKSNDSPFLSFL